VYKRQVEKLPVTVLSRTQRFDLRRIPSELLVKHFAYICEQEAVEADQEALQIIAAAAEGSVRDGLSILDQAIAHADLDDENRVTANKVRDMLGLADKSAQRRLLGHLLKGDAKALLAAIEEQYALGVEPLALMRALMDLTHRVTVAQVSGGEPDVPTAEERTALGEFVQRLSPAQLHRLWQLLQKGHEEVRSAPDPLVSAQMALLRTMHATDMPDPGKLSKKLEKLVERGVAPADAASAPGNGATASSSIPVTASIEWGALVQQIDDAGHLRIAQLMRDWIRVIELEPNRLVFSVKDGLGEDPAAELRDCLYRITGSRWQVEHGEAEGAPTLREQEEATKLAREQEIREHPMVKATFEAFPDAELLVGQDKVAQAGGSKWNR